MRSGSPAFLLGLLFHSQYLLPPKALKFENLVPTLRGGVVGGGGLLLRPTVLSILGVPPFDETDQ